MRQHPEAHKTEVYSVAIEMVKNVKAGVLCSGECVELFPERVM